MAILIDTPIRYVGRPGICRGHAFTSSHLISDLEGEAGTRELTEFAFRLGMKPEWIQYPGTWKEHFDVMNSRYAKAVALGAQPDGVNGANTRVAMAMRRKLLHSRAA